MILAALLILMYSIILHEISHGYVALLNGDPTARSMKRLTLNPIPHIDIVGTLILPTLLLLMKAPFLIGWAKPVPFNPAYFKNIHVGIFTVALAGPLTNILLAIGFAQLLQNPIDERWATVLFYGVSLNAMLAIFNLLPIPPLDGSKVLSVFLPVAGKRLLYSLERWGLLILIVLLSTGLLHQILTPLYRNLLRTLLEF